ncbi:MAG: FAD-binding oxidoreductase [Zoogloeaceae bacterium]|jgi:FAD/FMN-containing dehydrogenase|nr:FAD-binding oxidoreductase [Zoogloeaceae bacterium]
MPKRSESRADVLAACSAIVGKNHLFHAPEDIASCLTDWRGRYHGRACALVRPGNAEEVSALIRLCRDWKIPVVPQGGNTGLAGGATPDESGNALVLQTGRLRSVCKVDAENASLTAEAGVTLKEAREAALSAGFLLPLSLASEGSCQIGGILATNAGGIHALRYGVARDLVLGLEAVLPDGEIWRGLSALRKDNRGYDLRNLLIGAEGTLGVITAASFKLFPAPKERLACWLNVDSPAVALTLLKEVRAVFDAALTAFELVCPLSFHLVRKHFPALLLPAAPCAQWHVLCELCDFQKDETAKASAISERAGEFFLAQIDAGTVRNAAVASSATEERKRRNLWQWRENISEAQKREGVSVKHDISLPLACVPEFLSDIDARLARVFPGVRHTAFGHLGDGNLHFNLSMPEAAANARFLSSEARANRLVYDRVYELGGSISAEHGIGQLKRDILPRYQSAAALKVMRKIKFALDPENLMNPGKLF